VLTVDGLTMRFRGADAALLENVSFTLGQGTVLPLIGANGSGKTTLLKLVCGLIEPTGGSIAVNGFDTVASGVDARRSIGVSLYPERSFYFRLTCRQNLRYYASLRGVFGRRCRAEVERVLDLLGLVAEANVAFMRLSLGQRKRLGVARSLIDRPDLVLLDEPTANLDDRSIDRLYHALETHRRDGGAVLLSTHAARDLELGQGGHLRLNSANVLSERSRPSRGGRWIRVDADDAPGSVLGVLEHRYPIRVGDYGVAVLVPDAVSLQAFVEELAAGGVEPSRLEMVTPPGVHDHDPNRAGAPATVARSTA
jgi:ABC-type Na+ transport system ATPase subunit NatA